MLVGKDQHAQASGRGRGREENLKQAEACGNIITGLHRDARGNLTVVTVTSPQVFNFLKNLDDDRTFIEGRLHCGVGVTLVVLVQL
jgi:hypothetical protein